MSKEIIHITQDIIDRGKRQNRSKCPIAIALMETRSDPDDRWNVYCGRLMRHGFDYITTQYAPSHRLSEIIELYDKGYEMLPFSMVVDDDDDNDNGSAYLEGE